MNVGRPHLEGVRQHLLHQADDGRVSVVPIQAGGVCRNGQVTVKFFQAAFHRAVGGDAENHVASHQLGQAVHGFQIQRVVNGDVDGKAVVGNGDGPEAPGELRRDEFAHLLGNVHGAQVHDGQQGCGSRHLRDDVFCKIIGLDQEIDQVLGGRFLTARVLKNLFIQIAGLRKKFDEI